MSIDLVMGLGALMILFGGASALALVDLALTD